MSNESISADVCDAGPGIGEFSVSNPFLVIAVRYLHIVTACVLFGGAFFFRVLLPIGVRRLDPEAQQLVQLGSRRAFKMVVHIAFARCSCSPASTPPSCIGRSTRSGLR